MMLGAQSRRDGHRAGRWVVTAPILALFAVLAVVAAGCGGSSDTKANEAYANSVCSAIGTWEQQIKSIATSFIGGVSQASSRRPPSRRASRRPRPRPKRS